MLKKIATAIILVATGAVAANATTNRRIKKLATSELSSFSVGTPSKLHHYLWVEMKSDPNYYQQPNSSS